MEFESDNDIHEIHDMQTDFLAPFSVEYMVANHFDSSDSSNSSDSDDSGHDDSSPSENLFGSDDSDHSGNDYESDSESDDDMGASEPVHAAVSSAEDQLSNWQAWVQMRREMETERARLSAAIARPGESLSDPPPRISPSGEQLLDDFLLRIADAVQSLLEGAEESDQEGDGDDDEPISPFSVRSPRPIVEENDTDDEELTNRDLVLSNTGSVVDEDQDDDTAPLLSTKTDRLDYINKSDDLEVGSLSNRSDDDRRHVPVSGGTWIPANGRFSAEYRSAAQQRAREQGYPTVSEGPDGGPVALCIRETHVDLFLVDSPPRDDEAAAGDSDDDQGSLDDGSSQTAEREQKIDDDWREDPLALVEIGYTARVVSSLGLAVRVALSGLGCGVLFLALYLGVCCIMCGLEKLGIWALVSGPTAQCGLLAALLVVIL
ncbi:hypothetical protein BJ166DRAFT_587007 [Pestalotiopsis sp. NC0098]|nr:hypothetical protein BJ166DRAFT_587007 [Pestalotiopsis sp. NC0098]